MKSLKKLIAVLLAVFLFSGFLTSVPVSAAVFTEKTNPPMFTEAEIREKMETLIGLLDNHYFTTNELPAGNVQPSCDVANVIQADWLLELMDTAAYPSFDVTNFACQYFTTADWIPHQGGYGGYSCWGFANFAEYYLYSSCYTDNLVGECIFSGYASMENVRKYARTGDVIRFGDGNGHSVVFYSIVNDDKILALDSNWYSDCMVTFGERGLNNMSRSGSRLMTITRASNYVGPRENEGSDDTADEDNSGSEGSDNQQPDTDEADGSVKAGDLVEVTSAGLNVRMKASSSSNVVMVLTQGSQAYLTDVSSDGYWGKINIQGVTGWIFLQYTKVVPPPKPAVLKTVEVTASALNVRSGPSSSYRVVAVVEKGLQADVLKLSENGYWGMIEIGDQTGWISLSYTKELVPEEETPAVPEEPTPSEKEEPIAPVLPEVIKTVEVTASALNVRKGPGSNYGVMTTMQRGTVLSIFEISQNTYWGKIQYGDEFGWISLNYTQDLMPEEEETPVQPEEPEDDAPVIPNLPNPMKTVEITASTLYVRSGPASTFKALTTLPRGTVLEIYEISENTFWGMVWTGGEEIGWISLNYTKEVVQEEEKEEIEIKPDDPDDKNPTTSDPAEWDKLPVIKTVVTTTPNLCLRKGPGVSYGVLTTVRKDSEAEVRMLAEGDSWGMIRYEGYTGWISLKYTEEIEVEAEPPMAVKVRVTGNWLNFRQGPSTNYAKIVELQKGTILVLTAYSEDQLWGQCDYNGVTGWVSLAYTEPYIEEETGTDKPSEPAETEPDDSNNPPSDSGESTNPDSNIVNCSEYRVVTAALGLNVRQEPSVNGAIISGANYQMIVLVTQMTVNGEWGLVTIDGVSGWISLAYTALINPPANETQKVDVSNYPTLHKGDSGEYVRILQQRLTDLGYDCRGIDGDFGNVTYEQVRAFQKDHQLYVDGSVGQQTWKILFE